jgi:hypothetical protein
MNGPIVKGLSVASEVIYALTWVPVSHKEMKYKCPSSIVILEQTYPLA